MSYHRVNDATLAYDLGEFHGTCPDVRVEYPYVYCPSCRCVAHIDLVAPHIDHQGAKHSRHEEVMPNA